MSRMINEKNFLGNGKLRTREYIPSVYYGLWMSMTRAPRFRLSSISAMMTDPRIIFGLWLLKGPLLSKARFYVDAPQPVKEYLKKVVTRFWRIGASRALSALEWGFSCSEVSYDVKHGQIVLDGMKSLHPIDCKSVTNEGKLAGATVRNVPTGKENVKRKILLRSPKCLWHVHNRNFHPWYGQSRLFGAHRPWLELWSDGGARDTRRLYFHKYAYEGGEIYFPPGETKLSDNTTISNKDLAREIVEKRKTGGTLALPNITDERGNRLWEYKPAVVQPPPTSIQDYLKDLRDEMWEGMGIPPEVARAEGTGAYAGRAVPLDAFFSILQEILYWLLHDANEQIFRPLVEINFGADTDYEIIPFGLTQPKEKVASLEEGDSPGQDPKSQQPFQLALNPVSDEPPKGYQIIHAA